MSTEETPPRSRWAVAAALFALTLALLVETTEGLGYARDEGFYFHASRTYAAWFERLADDRAAAVAPAEIDRHFSVNAEHPALVKSLFALSNLVLERRWDLFDEPGTSFRFPAMVLAALAVAALYARAARSFGHPAGLVAACSFLFMPRVFFHAHLACFDVPITALFLFTVLAYERTLQTEGARWPIVTGILFGLALDTKHNAWFLPPLVAAHTGAVLLLAWRTRGGLAGAARRGAAALGAMLALGPLVLVALWPWLWSDPVDRFLAYARFHLEHDYYNMELFGETYFRPPFPRTYAPVMTLFTVPLVTLAAAAVGAASATVALWRDGASRANGAAARHRSPILWAGAVLVAYGPWLQASTPIFGGTKHWMPAYPFLALFAAAGFDRAVRAAEPLLTAGLAHLRGRALRAAFACCLTVGPAYQALSAHPWGLSAYTPIAGGAPGAATLGMNRGFWGYTTGSVVDYLNRAVPAGGRVYVHDTAWPSWQMLIEDGRLRADIQGSTSVAQADFALYHHEMHMQGEEYQTWVAFGTVRPDVVRGLDGVPVVWVYRKR
jgi:hypothetical protein